MKKQALIAALLLAGTFAANYGHIVVIRDKKTDKFIRLDLNPADTVSTAIRKLSIQLLEPIKNIKLEYKEKILANEKTFPTGWPLIEIYMIIEEKEKVESREDLRENTP